MVHVSKPPAACSIRKHSTVGAVKCGRQQKINLKGGILLVLQYFSPPTAHNTNNTPHCGPSAGEKPGTPFHHIRARQVGEPARPLKGREERSAA